MIALDELFSIKYGNQFDLNKMDQTRSEVHFVGRSAGNNGVTAHVAKRADINPYPVGMITVALGGSVLSSFLQVKPFYTGQNIMVLAERCDLPLTDSQKLFYCKAIHANAHRYTTCGREANRTLKGLPVPALSELPRWVEDCNKRVVMSLLTSLKREL